MAITIKTKFKNAIEVHIQPLYKIYDTLEAAKACSIIHQKEHEALKKRNGELVEALKKILMADGGEEGTADSILDNIYSITHKALKNNSND